MKKFILISALILATLASIIGVSTSTVNAAGSPEMARCFLNTTVLKNTSWSAQSDYFAGLAPAASTSQSNLNKFTWDYYVKPGTQRVNMIFSGRSVKQAKACYETFVWDSWIDPVTGQPGRYTDGSPILYQRIVSSKWVSANPKAVYAWSMATPRLGQRGSYLAAWVIGGK